MGQEPDNRGFSQRARWAGAEPIISQLMAKTVANPHLISLAAGFVDYDTLPIEPTRAALDVVWSDVNLSRAALQYGTTIGYPPLRQAVLDRMLEADGASAGELNVSVEQVVITPGSNQMLFLVSDTIADPGDIIVCGMPSYFVLLGMLRNLGIRATGVQTDQHGVIPQALDEEFSRLQKDGQLDRVRAIYLTDYYDNPSGVSIPGSRRGELVEIAKRWSRRQRIYIIEDTAYRELRYYGEDIAGIRSFDPEGHTVIHTGTFSKSFSPGIRVGWGILPPKLVDAVLAQKGNIDFGSPNFTQVLMATVLEGGLFELHLETMRGGYRRKLDTMLDAADEFLAPIGGVNWVRPTGGLYLWLELPETVETGTSSPLFDRAIEEGVLYVPGEFCYPHDGRAAGKKAGKNTLRLSFGIQSCQGIRRGMESLGRAIQQVS
ncbi:MAG: PLP-dependent aminotransferase family protein [Thermoguttaceae bacterium]